MTRYDCFITYGYSESKGLQESVIFRKSCPLHNTLIIRILAIYQLRRNGN